MAYKRNLSDEEAKGFTAEERNVAEKYLRKYTTKGIVSDEATYFKMYEMFLVGYSFHEIHMQYRNHEVGQIALTAAIKGWQADREKMTTSLAELVQAKVVRAVMEQVDMLTTMLSVTNAEHLQTMRNFIADPANNPAPQFKINDIKDYKTVAETLQKLVAGSTSDNKQSSGMFAAIKKPAKSSAELENSKKKAELKPASSADLISQALRGSDD